jgi:hypothetical protein
VSENRVLRRIFGRKREEVGGSCRRCIMRSFITCMLHQILIFFFLPWLHSLGLVHKIRLNFLEASQEFSFLQGRIVSPTPNLHPGGPGLCIYIPQRQGGYSF